MQAEVLGGGFAEVPVEAARAFRAAMQAMARPGRIETVRGAQPPAPLSEAAGVLALTLCDPETPVHLAGALDCAAVRDWITFHTGAPFVGAGSCHFAFGSWEALMPLDRFPAGTAQYPDRSATLIVQLPELTASGVVLRGPGIRDSAALSLPEVAAFRANAARFPLGLDFFLCAGNRLAGLPRSTSVEG